MGWQALCLQCGEFRDVQGQGDGKALKTCAEHGMPAKAPSSPAKPRLSLLPWQAMPSVARAMESGLKDGRQPHDYRKVPDRKHVYVDKALRHLAKHLGGELIDESGETHLAHAVCDLLIAMEDT